MAHWRAVLIALLFVAGQRPAVACSCVALTKAQLVQNATLIFSGTAIRASRAFSFNVGCTVSSADPVTFTFDVKAVYKGDVPKSVDVQTAVSGASCGYEFQSGKTYTVFATTTDGRIETNLCRGNVEGAISATEYGLPDGRPPRS